MGDDIVSIAENQTMTTRDGDGGFVLGLIAGAALGAAGAMLLAPKAGAETREGLANGFYGLGQAAREKWMDLSETASAAIDKGREAYEQAVTEGRESNARSTEARHPVVAGGARPRSSPAASSPAAQNS